MTLFVLLGFWSYLMVHTLHILIAVTMNLVTVNSVMDAKT